jgi:hypothetical protein
MCCFGCGAKIVTQKTTEVGRAEQPKRQGLFLKTPLYQNCTSVFKKIWVLGCGELIAWIVILLCCFILKVLIELTTP